MSKFRHTLNLLAVVIFTLTVSSLAQAQATRTWVSGVGDDVNPCSRTAPCKTFAGAISKTAAGGEIDALDPGGFGALTITKSITVDGAGTMASVLHSGVNGINVNDSATATPRTIIVVLRNLSINGAGTTLGLNGVNITSAKSVYVENCEIQNFSGNGINVNLTGGSATNGTLIWLDDVDITNGTGASSIGVRLHTTNSFVGAVMDRVRVRKVPIGVQVGNQSIATIRDGYFALGTTGIEVVAAVTNATATIENTMLESNTTGILAGSGTTRLSQVSIHLCSTAIGGGGTVRSSGNNRIYDNTAQGITPTIINPQ
jgi:hypothetical protein